MNGALCKGLWMLLAVAGPADEELPAPQELAPPVVVWNAPAPAPVHPNCKKPLAVARDNACCANDGVAGLLQIFGIGSACKSNGKDGSCCEAVIEEVESAGPADCDGARIELRLAGPPQTPPDAQGWIWTGMPKHADAASCAAPCEESPAGACDEQALAEIMGIWQRAGVTAGMANPDAFEAELRRLHARHAEMKKSQSPAEKLEHSQPNDEQGLHCVNALRGGATELEGLADRFERYGLYVRADALRQQSAQMRLDARYLLHGDNANRQAPISSVRRSASPAPKKMRIELSRFNQPKPGEASAKPAARTRK
jgi:hypothetical protein